MTTKTFPKKKKAVKTGVLNTAKTTASPVVEESKKNSSRYTKT